jgi:hypothetical protein
MTDGEALEQKLRSRNGADPTGGIPWMVVLDAEGKALITSDGPKGNIGCPYEPWEIEHFVAMLDKTRRSLGKDDLERLRTKTEKAAEKWRQAIQERQLSSEPVESP